MIRREPVPHDGFAVLAGRIALVLFPVVDRIFLRDPVHVVVPVSFCQNRGGGDRNECRVAFDDALVRNVERRAEPISVDEQHLRYDLQPGDGPRHGGERGIEDIDPVDLLGRYHFDGPGHGFTLDDQAEPVPVPLGHLLRIVEQRVVKIGRKDHRSGEYRPGQTPPAGLVATGLPKLVLVLVF